MSETAVCVVTYARPEGLRRLLTSLVEQSGVDGRYQIIVVDNDPEASASPVLTEFGESPVPIVSEVEPSPGIPAARNRSIQIARRLDCEFVAFIDDDEVASPGWLAALRRRIESADADAVSGPVDPVFPDSAPPWAASSGLYERSIFPAGAELDYASTANSMLRLSAISELAEPFNPAFRFTGGSDSYLYHSLKKRGRRIVFEPDALVYEHVPASRLSLRWLVARSYRQGITLARCDRLIHGTPRRLMARGARGLVQIPAGLGEAGLGLVLARFNWRRGLTRIGRGVGSIVGLFGVTYQEYRRP